MNVWSIIAATYGAGPYSGGTYNAGYVAPTPSAPLADTGVAVLGAVTFACLLIFVTLVVRFWRRKAAMALGKKSAL